MSDLPPAFSNAPLSLAEWRDLRYDDTYQCPICRHGQIAAITLMDAFACDFCRHIFTADLQQRSVRVEDSSQPMSWRWNGLTWQPLYRVDGDLSLMVWLTGMVLVLVPPALIGLSIYTFPPLPGDRGAWFPLAWLAATVALHLVMVVWLLLEYYQVPLYVTGKVRLQLLLGRR